MIDFNTLTGREISMIEELGGLSISNLNDAEAPKGKFLSALYFVAKRREVSDFTFNQALDTPIGEQNDYLGLGEVIDSEDEESEEGKDERSDESETD